MHRKTLNHFHDISHESVQREAQDSVLSVMRTVKFPLHRIKYLHFYKDLHGAFWVQVYLGNFSAAIEIVLNKFSRLLVYMNREPQKC